MFPADSRLSASSGAHICTAADSNRHLMGEVALLPGQHGRRVGCRRRVQECRHNEHDALQRQKLSQVRIMATWSFSSQSGFYTTPTKETGSNCNCNRRAALVEETQPCTSQACTLARTLTRCDVTLLCRRQTNSSPQVTISNSKAEATTATATQQMQCAWLNMNPAQKDGNQRRTPKP